MKTTKILAALIAAAALTGGAAHAQSGAPIHVVVAFPAGGPTDFVARTISEEFGRQMKRTIIIDNKPGANGNIAGEYVAHSTPDGTTLFMSTTGSILINPSLYPKMPYEVARDFAPVSLIVDNATILVVNVASPYKTATELVEGSKKSKEPIATASTGIGGMPHLAQELFKDASKANLLHVPYKGAAPAITDLLGNQIGAFFGDIPGLIGHIRGGKLRAIGIAAPKRAAVLPDVKTLAEQGYPAAEANNWYGVVAPVKVPAAMLTELNTAFVRTLANEEVRTKLINSGAEPRSTTPAELAALIKKDTAKWAGIIKEKNIKAE